MRCFVYIGTMKDKNRPKFLPQITARKDLATGDQEQNHLAWWIDAYFHYEVTTLESSQKVQRRDLKLFAAFMTRETDGDRLVDWTPRMSQAFKISMQKHLTASGKRRWNDRTVNRILDHIRTFAKWIHKHHPFPLSNPMHKIKSLATSSLLDVDRALTPTERRRLLDAADLLLKVGGRSKDRTRHSKGDRPRHKSYRPYRNRAIIYTLIETGMRRAAVTRITLDDVDYDRRTVKTVEKGNIGHVYHNSKEGVNSIRDYVVHERELDAEHHQAATLFLPSKNTPNVTGQLRPESINVIWKEVCRIAGIEGVTPHYARHAMGRHIIEKTGNIAAVQRQLGHKNAAYSMQYARITSKELNEVLDDRE